MEKIQESLPAVFCGRYESFSSAELLFFEIRSLGVKRVVAPISDEGLLNSTPVSRSNEGRGNGVDSCAIRHKGAAEPSVSPY